MKSLFVIAAALAILALCSVGVEGQKRPGIGRPARNCTSDEECRVSPYGPKGFCYNNFCFRSCGPNGGCPGRYYNICDTDNSRCVMCNVNKDCDRGVCNTDKGRCEIECNVDDDCTPKVCSIDKG